MTRNYWHLVVDVVLLLCLLGLILTGLLLGFVLPARSGQASLWGWTRHDWGDLHFWISMAMLTIVTVHLTLNWGWVCNVVCKIAGQSIPSNQPRSRLLAGMGFVLALVLLVGGFLWWANRNVQPDPRREGRFSAGQNWDGAQAGRMGQGRRSRLRDHQPFAATEAPATSPTDAP